MDYPRYRNKTVFDTKYTIFEKEYDVPRANPAEEGLCDLVHSTVLDIHNLLPIVNKECKQYQWWNDRMRRPEEELMEYRMPDISSFLFYFARNYISMTESTTWSGSDIVELLYVLSVVHVHLQQLYEHVSSRCVELQHRCECLHDE